MKISYIMITARVDFPYEGRPDLHLFTPTLECFKKQDFLDFEWIIVDALYEQRKDYFKGMKLPFKVKHVPALPNIWIENGFSGMSRQFNKGIIYADGELLFFAADGYMMQPTFMNQLWTHYCEGYFPFVWYFYDMTFNPDGTNVINSSVPDIIAQAHTVEGSTPYNFSGYIGKKISVDFRYVEAFKNPNTQIYNAGWNWFYGSSAVSMEAMLKINGWDEKFDGDKGGIDCDVGSRLQMSGYGMRFAMFRDLYIVRAVNNGVWNPSFNYKRTIKCTYALIEYARHFKQIQANKILLTDQDIEWIKRYYCAMPPPEGCTGGEYCKENHKWQYPFEHKAGYEGHDSSEEWFEFWKEQQTIFDLVKEREKRIRGEKYQEGTMI